jgi:hypothetical protein
MLVLTLYVNSILFIRLVSFCEFFVNCASNPEIMSKRLQLVSWDQYDLLHVFCYLLLSFMELLIKNKEK